MKKPIFMLLALLFVFCSCTQNADESLGVAEAVSCVSKEPTSYICITYNGEARYLDSLYEFPLRTALNSGEWHNDTAECIFDFEISLIYEGKRFGYSSHCGTLTLDGRTKQLSDSDRENLNRLFFALFEIQQESNS